MLIKALIINTTFIQYMHPREVSRVKPKKLMLNDLLLSIPDKTKGTIMKDLWQQLITICNKKPDRQNIMAR